MTGKPTIKDLSHIRSLISDMDGTLLNARKEVSPQNLEAIRFFEEQGGLFTLATGRMEHTVRKYAKLINVNTPVILYNGAKIYDFKEEKALWQQALPVDVHDLIAEIDRRNPDIMQFVYQGTEVVVYQQHPYIYEEVKKRTYIPLRHVEGIKEVKKEVPLFKVVLHHTNPERLKQLEKELREQTPYPVVYSDEQYLEILPPGVSKGEALKIWAEHTGITLAEMMSVGDNMNDVEMLQETDWGVAVDNAHPFVKKVADHVTVSCEDHAIARLVDHWGKGK